MKTTPLFLLLAVCGHALRLSAPAQTLAVSSLVPAGNQMTITVRNTGTATAFQLQGSPTMGAGTWAPLTATFNPVAGQAGFFTTTFTPPAGGRYFFRVLGTAGTEGDADGDGLADTLETLAGTGTNPALFDTDGDGFSDGVEFAAGTNPLNSAAFPPFANLPIVQFADNSKVVEEGAGVINLPLVSGNGSFSGTVTVDISANGNAVSGTDFTVPATVFMTGGTASLPLTLIDNLALSQTYRILILQVRSAPGQYTIGGGFRTTVVIGDNDAYWSGVLDQGEQQRNFRLRMLRQGGTSQVTFVSGSANDGLPQTTQAGTSDQSSGFIPAGIHPANVTSNTAAVFDLTSPGLPAGNQATLFGSTLVLNRTLRLQAGTGITPSSITPTAVYGTFTESLAAPPGSPTHLNAGISGTFGLVRDVPTTPSLTVAAP